VNKQDFTAKTLRSQRYYPGEKKKGFWLIGLVILVFLLDACAGAAGSSSEVVATPLPRSMKGYELYSWQVDGTWHYTLITGTNRQKMLEEITSEGDVLSGDGLNKLRANGTEDLKAALSRLPEGEQVFWVGPGWQALPEGEVAFGLPSEEIVEEIRQHCKKLGIELQG